MVGDVPGVVSDVPGRVVCSVAYREGWYVQ